MPVDHGDAGAHDAGDAHAAPALQERLAGREGVPVVAAGPGQSGLLVGPAQRRGKVVRIPSLAPRAGQNPAAGEGRKVVRKKGPQRLAQGNGAPAPGRLERGGDVVLGIMAGDNGNHR